MEKDQLKIISEKYLSGSDLEFFKRVWNTDLAVYKKRLENIGFKGGDKILDAGCGSGQWSIVMTEMYNEVYAVDLHQGRINALKELAVSLNKRNLFVSVSGIEKLIFEDNCFDAIFCYSVIFFTDVFQSIETFARILKRGGRVYINANGLGWYLHNLIETHNSSSNFNSRDMAIETIENTLNWFANRKEFSGQLCLSSEFMEEVLIKNGFRIVAKDGDGLINLEKRNESISFFKKSYFDKEGVYEIVAEKQ